MQAMKIPYFPEPPGRYGYSSYSSYFSSPRNDIRMRKLIGIRGIATRSTNVSAEQPQNESCTVDMLAHVELYFQYLKFEG